MIHTEKNNEYSLYIKDHICMVKQVWEASKLFFINEYWLDDAQYHFINNQIYDHDESKYSFNEFNGYRQYFYPVPGERPNKNQFDKAWNHHQKTNPHHWEYWVLISGKSCKPIDMPFEYIIEMLCDWTAMSCKFGGSPGRFYEKNKNSMNLTNNTIKIIEKYLFIFDHIYEDIYES